MYDQRLNRRLTDEDIPFGMTVREVKAALDDHDYQFFAKGDIPRVGSTEWTDNPTTLRVSTLHSPVVGHTLTWAGVREYVEKARAMPNLKDEQVAKAVERAADAAISVLGKQIPQVLEEAHREVISQTLIEVIEDVLKGHRPDPRRRTYTRLAVDRKLEPVEAPVASL